jgi:hypothetical protein
MDAERPNVKRSRKLWKIAVGIFALALLVVWVLFGFRVNLPGELASAQARWEAQGLDSYRYRVQLVSPWYIGGGVYITVRDGDVDSVERASNVFGEPTTTPAARMPMSERPDWYAQHFSDWFPADFRHYSVDGLFSFVEAQLEANPAPLLELCSTESRYDAQFDVTWGYIEDLRLTSCPPWDAGLGLACPILGDCSMGFYVSEFEVIAEG